MRRPIVSRRVSSHAKIKAHDPDTRTPRDRLILPFPKARSSRDLSSSETRMGPVHRRQPDMPAPQQRHVQCNAVSVAERILCETPGSFAVFIYCTGDMGLALHQDIGQVCAEALLPS